MAINTYPYDSVRYFFNTQSQLKDHIYKRSQSRFDSAKKVRSSIYTTKQLEEYNAAMKDMFLKNIGGIPFDDTPLNAKITSEKDYEAYKIQNIIFNSRKDTYVTGTMYIPHGITQPTAGVLFLCGHSEKARWFEEYQVVADTLAKAGFAVFNVDPVGQGERYSYIDKDGNTIIEPCVLDHDAAGIPAIATGRFMQSYFLCDEMRALDYMLTRTDIIDPKRIAVTGNSGGGTQTMAMMAADDRIAAAAPATFVTSREAYLYTGQPQDCEQIWYGITEMGYDHINPIMNIAPKPLAILAVNYDFFAIEGTMDTFTEAQRFYDMYGKKDNIALFRDDYTHAYTEYLALRVTEFFSKYLLGKEISLEQSTCELKPKEVFYNTKSGQVKNEIANARFIHEENNDIADALLQKRQALSPEERLSRAREWLEEKVTSHRTPFPFYLRKLEEKESNGLIVQSTLWRSQKDIMNYGVFIRLAQNKDKKLPVFLCLWENGTMEIGLREDFIRKKCTQGYEVLVLDVTGTGCIEADRINEKPIKVQYATMYKLCCDLLYMHDSLPALRSWDVLRAIEMLGEVYGIEEKDITVYCSGKYGVYGTVAAFLNENVGVVYDNVLKSVQDEYIKPWALEYCDQLPVVFPEMLKYFDYNEIMR